MAYICNKPETFKDTTIGSGQCVDFVKDCAKAPATSLWKEGRKVRGPIVLFYIRAFRPHVEWLSAGTAIATFKDGKYPNQSTGNHAAIYISQDSSGIWVWDQWAGQPVHKRYIKFSGGKGSPSNDADAFSVIS